MIASKNLADKINGLALTDVSVTPARFTWRTLSRLPDDLKEILGLLPGEHQEFIRENLDGESKFLRGVPDFDLTHLLHYHDEENENAESVLGYVKTFFQGRPVDVAQGKGHVKRSFPFTFDWVVVLDPENKVLYSFILNAEKGLVHAGRKKTHRPH